MSDFILFIMISSAVAAVMVMTFHYFIDELTDAETPDDRVVGLSSLFWFISIPYLSFLTCSHLYRFFKDYMEFCGKYSELTKQEMASKYNEVKENIAEAQMNLHYSLRDRFKGLPKDRPDLFKGEIVTGNYGWKLERFIGKNEKLLPGLIEASKKVRLEERQKEEQEKYNKKTIEERFEELSKK